MAPAFTTEMILVFLLGVAVGALLIAVGRQAAIERVRREFHAELESLLDREAAGRSGQTALPRSEADSSDDDDGDKAA